MEAKFKENVNLSDLTTLKVGGAAEYFAAVRSEEELITAADLAREKGLSVRILGGGSNLLINDKGVKGLVIKNEIEGIEVKEAGDEVLVTVGAGEDWDDFVARTVKERWWGLENLSGIPGTVGGTPIQNVGAYGVEVKAHIERVRAYDLAAGDFRELSAGDCRFSYRDSLFKSDPGKHLVVTSVTFRLSRTPKPVLHYKDLAERFLDAASPSQSDIRSAVLEIRASKFPDWNVIGTAGSFFKNPIVSQEEAEELHSEYADLPLYPESDGRMKVSLGYVLDKILGLKGYKEGNVGLYDQQALVLVNYGGGSATEVKEFSDMIAKKVFDDTGIKIEREPVTW